MLIESKREKFVRYARFTLGGLAALATFAIGRSLTSETSALVSRAPARQGAVASDGKIALSPGKLERLRESAQRPGGFGKLRSPLSASIRSESAVAARKGERIRLIATVASTVPSSRIEIVWRLPEGVVLAEGRLEDSLIGMQAGESRELEIVVIPSVDDNRAVRIDAVEYIGEEQRMAGAEYQTVDQPALDAELARNADLARLRYGDDVASRMQE